MHENYMAGNRLMTGLEHFECFIDIGFWAIDLPYPDMLHLLDKQYQGAKFILHTREVDDWLDSLEAHNRRYNRRAWLRPFARRVMAPEWRVAKRGLYMYCHSVARGYFSGRDGDFLEFDVTQGDGWEKLCGFLSRPIPMGANGCPVPFPSLNRLVRQ